MGSADPDPEEDNLDDLLEVLTVTARRLASVKLGRKYTGGKASPAELKKMTACAACGEVGHWRGDPECKVSGNASRSSGAQPAESSSANHTKKGGTDGKGKAHQAFAVMHSDLGDYEAHSGYGTAFSADYSNPGYSVTVVFSAQTVPFTSRLVSYMVHDTACQRTCTGRQWIADQARLLRDYDLEILKVGSQDKFQFGSGDPVISDYRAYLPVSFAEGMCTYIGAGVLDAPVPLLASNPLLKALGMVLDLPSSIAVFTSLGITVPVVDLSGHMAVNISAFDQGAAEQFSRLFRHVCWESASPELVLPSEQPSESAANTAASKRQVNFQTPQDVSASPAMVAKVALPAPEFVGFQCST